LPVRIGQQPLCAAEHRQDESDAGRTPHRQLVDDGSDAGAVQAMGGATDPLRPVITGRFRED